MPAYVARRVQDALNRSGKAVNGAHVVLAGVTYKPNVTDHRETPARPLALHLQGMGGRVSYVDPMVEEFQVGGRSLERISELSEAIRVADVLVLLQAHEEFINSTILDSATCILDTSGRLTGRNVERL